MVTAKDTSTAEWMTKEQVASYLQVSKRQVELLVTAGNLPRPSYLGKYTPRWKRSELDSFLLEARGGK